MISAAFCMASNMVNAHSWGMLSFVPDISDGFYDDLPMFLL
jgi:hypothetical protein